MSPNKPARENSFPDDRCVRRGLSLAELLVASVVTSLIALATMTLATAVRNGSDYQHGLGTATQHGTVVIERMQRTLQSAFVNDAFPGFKIVATSVSGYSYPDTLIVWDRTKMGRTVTSELPLVSELVVFSPSTSDPSRLQEMVWAGNSDEVPTYADNVAWQTLLTSMRSGATVRELTDMVRVANAGGGTMRACLRFESLSRPTDAQLSWYRGLGAASQTYDNWRSLPWPQDMYSRNSGTRQLWCRIEVQMVRDADSAERNARHNALPFFGSVALYYAVQR